MSFYSKLSILEWTRKYATELKWGSLFLVGCGCAYYFSRWKKRSFQDTKHLEDEIHKKQCQLIAQGVAAGNLDLVLSLLKAGVDEDSSASIDSILNFRKLQFEEQIVNRLKDMKQLNLFEIASLTGNVQIMKELLKASLMKGKKVKQGQPLLSLAIIGGHTQMVKFLVEECGTNVNTTDKSGFTALHEAAARGKTELVEYLIANHADVNSKSPEDEITPLMLARTGEICSILIASGADIYHRTLPSGLSVALVYCVNNCTESLQTLLDIAGPAILFSQFTKLTVGPVFCFVTDGEMGLFLACGGGFAKITEMLLEAGVDPNAQHPITGDSALLYAILGGDDKTISMLQTHGASSMTIDLDRLEALSKHTKGRAIRHPVSTFRTSIEKH